jgi:hypothetical protein
MTSCGTTSRSSSASATRPHRSRNPSPRCCWTTRSTDRTCAPPPTPARPGCSPGRRAGQPLRPEHLAALVHELGVPTVSGRATAIRQHVLVLPAPFVADALGYHYVTTAKLGTQAGATWSRYATGNHTQPPSRRTRDG